MKLHHSAYKIAIGYSQLIQEFCEFMGAQLVWEGHDQGREIAMLFDNGFRIQFSEINESPIVSKNKQEAHLAFLSASPQNDIKVLDKWFNEKKVNTRLGEWSDREHWIDCPEIFIDFVIEVFNTKNRVELKI
jgi:hypothetical protein